MTRALIASACTIALSAVTAAQQTPTTPPRDTPRPAAGVASVSGRVTDKDTGQPLRRIRVQLMAQAAGGVRQFESETDADGRYTIADVPAGEYWALAFSGEYRFGHMGQSYGFDEKSPAFGRPPPLDLKAGDTRRDVDFALTRLFAIEGHVRNEFGEPLAYLEVTAEGVGRPGAAGRRPTTDDRGFFRLYGLTAGSWRVCASPSSSGAGEPWERPTTGDSLQAGFIKTCFPSPDVAAGEALAIKNADMTGVVIQMLRANAYTLSGRIVLESGSPAQRANVSLARVRREPFGSSSSIDVRFADGAFIARGLTPGDYVLRAAVEDPNDSYRTVDGYQTPRELAYVPVTIGAADVTSLLVVTSRGADIAGRIIPEGDGPMPSAGPRPVVVVRRDPETAMTSGFLPSPSAPVREDGTFELTRLHGPAMIALDRLPAGWIVKSVRHGVTDITDVPMDFARSGEPRPVDVRVTNRVARLTPIILDENGKPTTAAMVVLVPVDPARWKGGVVALWERIVAMSSRNAEPRPSLCRPGEYIIAAVSPEDLSTGLQSMDAIKTLAERGQRITLKEGADHRPEVRIVKLAGGRRP